MGHHLIHLAEFNITIIELSGDLLGGEETEELRTIINNLNQKGNLKLVIDFSAVGHVNSFALGVLATGCVKYNQRNGTIVLCGLNTNVTNIFYITRLTMVFQIFANQEDAIDYLVH